MTVFVLQYSCHRIPKSWTGRPACDMFIGGKGYQMKVIAILALTALLPFPTGSAAADDITACATPGKSLLHPIVPTHTLPPYPRQSVRGFEQGETVLEIG